MVIVRVVWRWFCIVESSIRFRLVAWQTESLSNVKNGLSLKASQLVIMTYTCLLQLVAYKVNQYRRWNNKGKLVVCSYCWYTYRLQMQFVIVRGNGRTLALVVCTVICTLFVYTKLIQPMALQPSSMYTNETFLLEWMQKFWALQTKCKIYCTHPITSKLLYTYLAATTVSPVPEWLKPFDFSAPVRGVPAYDAIECVPSSRALRAQFTICIHDVKIDVHVSGVWCLFYEVLHCW